MLMDEPFSRGRPGGARPAAGRVAARCSPQLGKTILFVTHDIDEAIKPG
jgi:ABC-type proline/glycine betaine transport system ATPase subunit